MRDMKWSVENMRGFLEKHGKKKIPAIIEHVRDGSTVKALLLPDFYTITLMLTGIRVRLAKTLPKEKIIITRIF